MKKFSIWQKIQAILCFLILLCVFAPLGWIAISPSTASTLLNGILLDAPMSAAVAEVTVMQRVIMGASVLVGVLCSLRMLALMLGKGKKDRTGVSMPNTSEGAIHISVPAVETLVSQGIRDVPGLSDVRMKVHDYHDSISIEITMSARSDINIPETMMRLQSRIKAYVQESAGIEVREVRLNVDKVILADGGIPALPAGRMKRAGSSEQEIAKADYKPQSFTWKKDASEPVVETKEETKSEPEKPAEEPKPEAKPEAKSEETQPAAVQSDKPVDDDDSDEGRRGLFGRLGHKRHNEAKSEPAEAERKPEEGVDEFIKRFENGEDSVSQAQQNAAENVEKAIDEAAAVETARAAAEEAAMFEAESTEAGVAGAEDAELESAIAEEAADDLMAAQQQSEDAVVEEEASETEASEEEHAEEGTSEETSADEAPEEIASEEVNAEKTASEEEPFEEPKPAAPIVIGDTASDMGTLKNDSDDNHTNVISL
jgi:hypothetical protein